MLRGMAPCAVVVELFTYFTLFTLWLRAAASCFIKNARAAPVAGVFCFLLLFPYTPMARPRRPCNIEFCPKECFFKPAKAGRGVACISMSAEEAEALRLKNIKGLNQTRGARAMGISQSTFQRLLSSAHKKAAQALILGKAIRILKSNE